MLSVLVVRSFTAQNSVLQNAERRTVELVDQLHFGVVSFRPHEKAQAGGRLGFQLLKRGFHFRHLNVVRVEGHIPFDLAEQTKSVKSVCLLEFDHL